RQRSKQRRRKAATSGGLAGRESDLPLRPREPGDTVHQKQDMAAAIAEEFGNRRGHVGGLDALHRPPVWCGRDDDRTLSAVRTELPFDELSHLAAPLSNQRDHYLVGVGAANNVGEQRRFADAGLAENADALPACAG